MQRCVIFAGGGTSTCRTSPRLSSYWVDFVTPVNSRVSHYFIESLGTEVVVTDPGRATAAFAVEPLGVRDAIRAALDDQVAAVEADLLDRSSGGAAS